MNPESQLFDTASPPQHADIHVIDANETYLFGSRGSLKTWLGISLYMLRRVFEMPRSTGVCVGLSFEHLMDNTIPPIKSFLSSRGFVEDEHYCIMKPPPDHWPKPYAGVSDPKYKHAWTWYNGTEIQLVSLRRRASANSVSAQWGWFDEVKFQDQRAIEDDIIPIFRPIEISHPLFEHCSGYLSKFFSTDKDADPVKIKWLLKKRELVDHKKVDLIRSIQYGIYELETECLTASKARKTDIIKTIFNDERRLAKLRSKLVYVAEINANDVRPILGEKWYKDKQRNSKKHEWDVIYMNKDPDRPGELFYPAWVDEHIYDKEGDIDINEPLIIASDYQHTVAPIPIAQIATLPGCRYPSINYVDEVYTLHPQGLRDAVKLFCIKHSNHCYKLVYYVYDHTAKGGRVDADEYWQIVVDELEKNDWSVVEIYTGQAPGHYQKYNDTIDWMENKNKEHLDIRINEKRCPKLIISITGAGAVTKGKETKKDKSGELQKDLDQSETTHFSDAFDMTNDAVLKQKLINSTIGNAFAFR